MEQVRLAILCGGQSAEHEVSLISATHVLAALQESPYIVQVIYISQQGVWHLLKSGISLQGKTASELMDSHHSDVLVLLPGHAKTPWALQETPDHPIAVDCVFPVLHGSKGEDGVMQGVLEMLGVPYVGCDVLSSAACMDKQVTKTLLVQAGLPTANWLVLERHTRTNFTYAQVKEKLGHPFFVKPANCGSSVGISKVKNAEGFDEALEEAFAYDNKVIIETYIAGREIECSVLGNENAVASLPGEVIVHHEFYSYTAKYLDKTGSSVVSPADLPRHLIESLQKMAVLAFYALNCVGMVRVDFFITEQEDIYINELNTIPGFTPISLYPKNWVASGIAYADLMQDLVQLALAHHQQRARLLHVLPKNTLDRMS